MKVGTEEVDPGHLRVFALNNNSGVSRWSLWYKTEIVLKER
jgi:hypothetical protein